tara:strand:+ start:3092 stop:4297 length:1206 start_codon:yes stop_codon:yes gene_type:complete
MGIVSYDNIKIIHVELSNKCNAMCPCCPRNVEGGYNIPWIDKDEFSIEQFKHIFPKELITRLDEFIFCGNYGDPGTCKDLVPILKYINHCSNTVHIRLHTNGGMRTPNFWQSVGEQLTDSTRHTLTFSIDGLEDTNHVYRKNVSWEKLMDNVISFVESGGSATWEYLIFGHNQHQIEDARKLSNIMGFKKFIPKRALGFTDETKGSGFSGINVLDKDGRIEYVIPRPDKEYENAYSLQQRKVNGRSILITDIYNPKEQLVQNFKFSKEKQLNDIDNGQLSWLDTDDYKYTACQSIQRSEIYVDAGGNLHPCCFLGHVSQETDGILNHQYYRWMEENVGREHININSSSLKEMLERDKYFSKIADSWSKESHTTGRIALCTKHCNSVRTISSTIYEDIENNE